MKVKPYLKLSLRPQLETIVIPYFRLKGHLPCAAFKDAALNKLSQKPIKMKDFEGGLGEVFIYYPQASKEKRLVLLGLGDYSKINTESMRKAFASLVRFCHKTKLSKLGLALPSCDKLTQKGMLKGVLEGLFLTNYVFDKLKSCKESNNQVKECHLFGVDKDNFSFIKKEQNICEGVNFARDLVNENADTVNASKLVEIAKGFDKEFKALKTTILDKKKLELENLNLLLKVNQGAQTDPALIVLNYQGSKPADESIVIVGKGVTFDTGGLQIKPRLGNIIHMKSDMGGAAAVLGTIYAAAKLKLNLNIIGVIAACENAVGPKSFKPGDVIDSHMGKTVEVTNTDAEGRLILADALSYVQKKLNPSQMIDIATLTGGVVAALGHKVSGFMSNSDKLSKALVKASEASDEKLWELPLIEEYREAVKSNIADLKNSSSSIYPSAIVAGLFLKEFVSDKVPWAHIDIAGTSYLPDPAYYQKTKGTGVGVRLLIAFLEDLLDSFE